MSANFTAHTVCFARAYSIPFNAVIPTTPTVIFSANMSLDMVKKGLWPICCMYTNRCAAVTTYLALNSIPADCGAAGDCVLTCPRHALVGSPTRIFVCEIYVDGFACTRARRI